jgi:precorrin-2 dehydrogenase/sirohydrochlorin ferrochelatase
MIPLFHDFAETAVLIVGGGPVALRKARRFAEEADVTAVAPDFVEGFETLSCDLIHERVGPGNVDDLVADTALVIAATDDEAINDRVAAAGERADCLVNRADQVGDVVVPSHIETSELSVAISSHGGSPTTSKYLRQRLTPIVEEASQMAAIQQTLRADLKETVPDQAERKRLLRAVIESDAVWSHLPEDRTQAMTAARRVLARQ